MHLLRSPWRLRIAVAFLLLDLGPVRAENLRGAVEKVDITPGKPVMLGGYASRTNLSRGVHDPLSARFLALEQNGHRLLLISLDLLGFYNETAEPLRQAILAKCQLKPSELFLCAIHTHSAPILNLNPEKGHSNNVEFTRWLERTLPEVARRTLDRMVPVAIGLGVGASPVGANRREVVRDDAGTTKIVLGRNPSILPDREVQVLKLIEVEGDQLSGVLFAYACHSTSLGPRNYLISGDIHGLAAQFIEKHLGSGLVAPAFAGASGDIDPWYRVLAEFKTTNGWIPEPILLGTLLGEEVAQVLPGIRNAVTNAPIKTLIRTVSLPGKKRGQIAPSAGDAASPLVVTAARVGDIAFIGLGGEIFTDIGREIKRTSPFAHTFILTHCNGAGGYLPTRASYPQGGYEVESSPFAPGADDQIIQEAQRMLAELR